MNFNNPVIRNLSVAAVSSLVGAFYVLSANAEREYPSISNVEMQTLAIEEAIQRTEQLDDLPELGQIWTAIRSIASSYDVTVMPLATASDAGLSNGDIPGGTPWFGVLQGKSKNVAVAALEIQKAVPVIFGSAALDSQMIGLGFAALGTSRNNQ